ncbi:MAG: glucose-1-phosphate cytidylyltransferase [Labilithrix sp.]|nr:glucose-1-phosphate cytidylyltransferase [Labilithrix sp.]MCW5816960.1 glucose-1-phosphate cytidylyltransferase [Labilithrix sp.]
MKVVILAGGMGTRLSEETEVRPKPMVEIGGRPIIWHIMQRYAAYGFNEFVVALGYKGDFIKRYFRDYCALHGNMTVRMRDGEVQTHERDAEDWTIHLVDTGLDVMTGGRVKRLESHLSGGTFLLTYGDGVADIDLRAVVDCHRKQGRTATITAVRPPARFGGLVFANDDEGRVHEFTEKPQIGEGWINGGFMVFEPEIFRYLDDDQTVLEAHALERLAAEHQLSAYRHQGFWQCMDTMRDVKMLESLWQSGNPPWHA